MLVEGDMRLQNPSKLQNQSVDAKTTAVLYPDDYQYDVNLKESEHTNIVTDGVAAM